MRNSSIDIKWLFESDFLSLSKRIKCTKQNLFICVWWFQILLWILKFSIIVCLFTYLFVPHVFLTHATSPNSCYLTAARRPRGRFFSSGSGPRAAVGGMQNLGLSEIGAEGQKVQKSKLVTFFLL